MKKLKPNRWGLTFSLMAFIFIVIAVTVLIAGAAIFTLFKTGQLHFMVEQFPEPEDGPDGPGFPPRRFLIGLLQLLLFSGLLSFPISWFFGRRALNPLRNVIGATQRVAAGDFNVRVELKGVGELEELSRSFNKMTQELASIETMRSDFINNISHEFKTPIASIKGFAEVLQNGNLNPEEQQECLAVIITESKRLAALSTNILSLSKYENTKIIAEKTVFQADEQIRRAIAFAGPEWAGKNIDLQADLEDGVTFEGNEDLIHEVWLNLLDNAIKFSPRGGSIYIQLRRENGRLRFSIQDSGIGMDTRAQAYCFDKFYQADESKSKSGNGLGLAIVKRIVELHNGTVEVQSAPGQGSTFFVTL